MSSNRLTGPISNEITHLQGLDILLNLSRNALSGPIPEGCLNLSKLENLDLFHNMLIGNLGVLADLDNLVSLDVSYNNLSGSLPDTKFFQDLPASVFSGNQELCIDRNKCHKSGNFRGRAPTKSFIVCIVVSILATITIAIVGIISLFRAHIAAVGRNDEDWDLTPFQKLNFTVNDIITRLSDSNIVGQGCSGMAYRVETPMKEVIAVKKLWPAKNGELPGRDFFSAEVQTLGSIRHKNIVRLWDAVTMVKLDCSCLITSVMREGEEVGSY